MNQLLNALARLLSSGRIIAFPIALVGGFIAALNPCCLALYPAAAATCCGVRDSCCGAGESSARRSLRSSAAFVAGMAIAMTMLGILAALAGRVMPSSSLLRYAIAVVPLAMGMHVLGWIKLPLPAFSMGESRVNVAASFGCGFALSLVIAPCGTPVLASVLSYAALKGNIYFGALLLFVYGLGTAIPVLVAASLSSRFARWLDLRGYQGWVDRTTGALLLGLAFYLLWIA
ncbi:MAG: cytochrome c biogenesis CcdA family protein [Terriglobales bacterium]